MNLLAQDYPAILLSEHETPCLSLYQPTHRRHPEKAQDAIRFRNLVRKLEESLKQKYSAREYRALLEPFKALAEDRSFWNHTADGLAVLGAPGFFRVFRLQRPVVELAIVADSFHTKPLLRIVQSADRYHILALNRHEFKLFEGNRDSLDEIPAIDTVMQAIDEQLGRDVRGLERAERVYGHARGGKHTQHGVDMKQDTDINESRSFFRAVDQAVMQNYSQPSGQRLLLAALPEHHNMFRTLSRNPLLMKEAIDVHPDDLSLEELRDRSWQVVQPYYLERLNGFVEAFRVGTSNGRGTDVLDDIATAATSGRVATLLIEADRLIPGRIDIASGKIQTGDLGDPGVNDVLDELGEHVIRTGGEVVIVPTERMPTGTGAAAIYRY